MFGCYDTLTVIPLYIHTIMIVALGGYLQTLTQCCIVNSLFVVYVVFLCLQKLKTRSLKDVPARRK